MTTTLEQIAPPGCISVKEALSLSSGDYPGYTVEESYGQMVLTYEAHLRDCNDRCSDGWGCGTHSSEVKNGGPEAYIEMLADSFRDEGWHQGSDPISVDMVYGVLNNGHHRVLAAARAGLYYLPLHYTGNSGSVSGDTSF